MRSLIAPLLLLVFSAPLAAQSGEDFFRADVPVADHGARELNRVARSGLAQVLVKVSGSRQVLAAAQIEEALQGARNYLQQYQYQRTADGELRLIAHFDREQVMAILTAAGQPVWVGRRPVLLVWMALDDGSSRSFANAAGSAPLRRQLQEEFSRRGIPVSFPLYDLRDNMALDVQELWEQDSPAVLRASQRYRAEHVLLARLSRDGQQRWLGDWLYLDAEGSAAASLHAADDRAAASTGVALAAEAMAARYALHPTAASRADLLVRVDGLQRYRDYRQVLSHLQGLELVDEARLEWLRSETAVFRLRARLQPQQLRQVLQREGKLIPGQPLADPAAEEPALAYRWRP